MVRDNLISVDSIRWWVQILLSTGLVMGVEGPFRNVTGFELEDLFVDYRTFSLALVTHWQRCINSTTSFRAFAAGIAFLNQSSSGGLISRISEADRSVGNQGPSENVIAVEQNNLSNPIVYNMIVYSDLRRYPMELPNNYSLRHAGVDWFPVAPYNVELDRSNAWGGIKYAPDAYTGKGPTNVRSRVLFINGEIDGQTPRHQAYFAFNEMTVTGTGSKTVVGIRDQGHTVTTFGCGLSVAKSFFAGTVDTSCGMSSANEPAQPLATKFEIPLPYSEILLGQTAAFDGVEVIAFCEAPSDKTVDRDGCERCFEYCSLRAMAGDGVSRCSCLSTLSRCINSAADVPDPTAACEAVREKFPNDFEGCPTACTASASVPRFVLTNGALFVAVLAMISTAF